MAATDIQPLACDSGTGMDEGVIMLVSAEGITLRVKEAVALELQSLKHKIKTNYVVRLPHTSYNIICLVIQFCKSKLEPSMGFDAEFVKLLGCTDDVTLLNLIQAAHHLKIRSLMDQTCSALFDRVHKKTLIETVQESKIDEGYVHVSKRPRRDPGSDRLRSHGKEAFINISYGVDLHYFLSDYEVKMETLFRKTEDLKLNEYVAEFMNSSDFVVMKSCLERVKDLCLSNGWNNNFSGQLPPNIEPCLTDLIRKLRKAMVQLKDAITKDPGIADLLSTKVAWRLVEILKNFEILDIKHLAAEILSRLSFVTCGDVIRQAIPVLLKALSNDCTQIAVAAATTLTRVALLSSKDIKISHFEAVHAAVRRKAILCDLIMFLVFVCRGHDLSWSEKKKVVLPILEELFREKWNYYSHTHMVRACYALSYLTYARCVIVQDQTCKRLVEFTLHVPSLVAPSSLASSALGVVGNIVRWGSPEQIQYLVKDCGLLQCLKKVLCSYKKFQMEGCQIISNIAVRRETLIKDMDEAGLTDLLSRLLEADESDVKMEAAWAIFNMRDSVTSKYKHIENYAEGTLGSVTSKYKHIDNYEDT